MSFNQQGNTTTIPGRRRERERLLRRFPGLEVAVARRYKVTRSLVCRVFHKQATSARIERGIMVEMARRQARENGAAA